ncbi:MAG: Hsp20/alpha crystallin family protein [Planctomycetota bacterium]
MTDLKTWSPFRFLRHEKNHDRTPARAGNGSPRGFADFRGEVERMIERVWSDPFASLETPDRWFGDFRQGAFTPKLDVTDDKDALRVAVEIPGVELKDLDLECQDGLLTIKGEKRHEETKKEEGCYRTERSYGWFQRTVPLPAEIDASKAEARFDTGGLTVRPPKPERANGG